MIDAASLWWLNYLHANNRDAHASQKCRKTPEIRKFRRFNYAGGGRGTKTVWNAVLWWCMERWMNKCFIPYITPLLLLSLTLTNTALLFVCYIKKLKKSVYTAISNLLIRLFCVVLLKYSTQIIILY